MPAWCVVAARYRRSLGFGLFVPAWSARHSQELMHKMDQSESNNLPIPAMGFASRIIFVFWATYYHVYCAVHVPLISCICLLMIGLRFLYMHVAIDMSFAIFILFLPLFGLWWKLCAHC
jgi:hypothetical protein